MIKILVLLLVFLFLLLAFSHYSISFLVRKIYSGKIVLKSRYGFFILPLFYYQGSDIHFQIKREFGIDEMDFEIKKLSFWINPFLLFLGKLEIRRAKIKGFKGKYVSRIPPKDKIKWLPPSGRVFLKNSSLENGELLIEDKVVISQTKILLRDINIYKTSFDLAYPVHLFFFTKNASCNLGSGFIKTELIFPNHGFLKVSGITWGEFINIGGMTLQPLVATVELHADYKHLPGKTDIRGIFGKKAKLKEENINDTNERFAFQFSMNWKDYRLPVDMALQKIIMLIFEGTIIGGVVHTAVDIIRNSIMSMIRKDNK